MSRGGRSSRVSSPPRSFVDEPKRNATTETASHRRRILPTRKAARSVTMAPATESASPSASLAMGAHARGCETERTRADVVFHGQVAGARVARDVQTRYASATFYFQRGRRPPRSPRRARPASRRRRSGTTRRARFRVSAFDVRSRMDRSSGMIPSSRPPHRRCRCFGAASRPRRAACSRGSPRGSRKRTRPSSSSRDRHPDGRRRATPAAPSPRTARPRAPRSRRPTPRQRGRARLCARAPPSAASRTPPRARRTFPETTTRDVWTCVSAAAGLMRGVVASPSSFRKTARVVHILRVVGPHRAPLAWSRVASSDPTRRV